MLKSGRRPETATRHDLRSDEAQQKPAVPAKARQNALAHGDTMIGRSAWASMAERSERAAAVAREHTLRFASRGHRTL
eukprot:12653924-Alexandrium_andersonii.AAC.1